MRGTVTIIDRGDVRVHSYTAAESSINVTTQLIETPQRLIAVDGQVSVADGREVASYARSLGKPLDRLIITHEHPDHFQGAAEFGAPIHALPVVRDQMAARGDLVDPDGIPVPAASVAPAVEIAPGVEIVDGVALELEAVSGGETADQLLIRLPEHGIIVAQDLVYNGTHVFVGHNDIPRWRDILRSLDDPAYPTILPGHGLPAGREVLAEMDEYLLAAAELLGDSGPAFKAAMIERFPHLRSPIIIDISNLYLFGTPIPFGD
jgi:glyoxylase-like metal-dependent hydrolase (beta-lactamase superfamily II)